MTTDFKATQVQTNKIIVTGSFAGDGSNQLLIYNYAADDSGSPNQGVIDPTKFDTSSGIGSDVFLFVSGGVATRGIGGSYGVTVMGGDLHLSGNLTVDGTSPGGGGGLATGKQYVAPYTATTSATTLAIGQFSWVPADYTGLTEVSLRAIMSTGGTANHTGSLQVYNLTSGSYLDLLDTPSVSKHFVITSSIPTLVTSSNLLTGITNFDNSSTAVYEVRVSGSSANNTFVGGVELVFG